MEPIETIIQDKAWLSPGLACKLLNINEATLRHWADKGMIRTFRTPGGHRRLSSEDIQALMANGQPHPHSGPAPFTSEASVLPHIRRKLTVTHGHNPAWLERFDRASQERMRTLGRELLSLCMEGLGYQRHADLMARARALGTRYVAETQAQGLSLSEAVEAFLFFRGALLEALRPALARHGGSAYELSRSWQQLSRITDEVLLNMTQAFPTVPVPPTAAPA
jgi:excisionase family DNA binding protein